MWSPNQEKIVIKNLYITISITILYVFLEWVFYVTKPSFMWAMSIKQDIVIFLLTMLIFVVPEVIIILLFQQISKAFVFFKLQRSDRIFYWFGAILSSVVSASFVLILIDNFTYTLFKVGVVSTHGVSRALYALFFIVLIVVFFKKRLAFLFSSERISSFLWYFLLSLLVVSGGVFLFQLPVSNFRHTATKESGNNDLANLPNIILLGIDGVNAENMSVYGYERETTPNIKKWSEQALIIENAFSNSGNTGGSLTSLLTGKHPLDTRVIYPPDILVGEDAYQHLPSLLKQLGYHTVQITMPSFGDAYERNIRNGFDIANFRSEGNTKLSKITHYLGAENGFYFANVIVNRILERVKHLFFIKKMDNPYEIVTQPVNWFSEEERFAGLLETLDNVDTNPVFLHVHMLGTHGAKFAPRERVFSAGEEQNEPWMTDFYDDAIRDFDLRFNELFDYLSEKKMLENTLIILYSDHGEKWNSRNRVPLIFWFPDAEYVGMMDENVQLLDVAPTILDYLDAAQPDWMQGQSILSDEFVAENKIFSADVASNVVSDIEGKGWSIDVTKISPPFYQLGRVNLVVCNRWYSLDMVNLKLSCGEVGGSTVVCKEESIPSSQEATSMIFDRLKQSEYDITSIALDSIVVNSSCVP